MPGGLLSLVCYGNENVILNGNPEVTWFYKSFLRHTHFAQEPVQVPLEGPGTLAMDAPILLKAKIPRQGDLLSDLTLRVTVPDIFSKLYFEPTPDASGNLVVARAYEFAWVRQIGVRMIDSVTLTIGGTQVQQFNSDWISARALMDLTNSQYAKWRYMVGDIPEFFDPASGVYADISTGTSLYPNVMGWRGTSNPVNPMPIQNNAPSIPGRILRIPLGLWFSDYIANSLPLVGLQYHDVEIQINMRPIRDLYTVLDPSGNRVRPGVYRLPYIPTDQYVQVWNPTLYGPLPNSMANLYGTDSDPLELMRNFLTDISGATPVSDGWSHNATLEATYTFVREQEQTVFSQKTLRYTVRQMNNFPFYGINTRATYRLDVHNVSTRIVYFLRRSDAIPYRNQSTNLTNWMYPLANQRPFVTPYVVTPTTGGLPNMANVGGTLRFIGRSGLNIAGTQRQIMRSMFITANGQPLFDSQDAAYFSQYVPYRYMNGDSAPFSDYGLATQTEMWPLYAYSFSLEGSSVEQPKGTLNTSRIDRLELDVDVEPIPIGANYTYELQVFVETINFLEITSGMAGLKFAK
jgi:hypothetical protein